MAGNLTHNPPDAIGLGACRCNKLLASRCDATVGRSRRRESMGHCHTPRGRRSNEMQRLLTSIRSWEGGRQQQSGDRPKLEPQWPQRTRNSRKQVHCGLKSSRFRRIMSGSPLVTLHIIPRKRSALGRVDAGKVIAKLVPSHPAARQRWGEAAAGRAWAIAILPTTLHMLTPIDASQHRFHTRARLLVQRAWAQRHEGATFMYAGRVSSPETPVAGPKR